MVVSYRLVIGCEVVGPTCVDVGIVPMGPKELRGQPVGGEGGNAVDSRGQSTCWQKSGEMCWVVKESSPEQGIHMLVLSISTRRVGDNLHVGKQEQTSWCY